MSRIAIDGLRVEYPGFVLGPINVDVEPGITAIIGPNGSGKTTLLRAINGLVPGAAGRATVKTVDLMARTHAGMKSCVFVPDGDEFLFSEMSLPEFWRFYCSVRLRSYGDDPEELLVRAYELASRLQLEPGDTRIRDFSLGMRRKAQLITGLMTRPEVLMIDEPQTGLDFVSSHKLREILRESCGGDSVILMSNHDLDSVARVADTIIILRAGVIVGRSTETFADSTECEQFVAGYFS